MATAGCDMHQSNAFRKFPWAMLMMTWAPIDGSFGKDSFLSDEDYERSEDLIFCWDIFKELKIL